MNAVMMLGRCLVLCALVMAATELGATPSASDRLQLSGSTTMAPLVGAIARRFEQSHPGIRIDVRMGGSGKGIEDVKAHVVDLGMVSRPLLGTEQDLYNVPFARDGVAVIVHSSNPVRSLSDQQLRQIYSGALRNWRQVGGNDGPIHLMAGTASAGSTGLFADYLGLAFDKFAAPRQIGPNRERIATVAADPLAIIYVSVGEAERMARNGAGVRLLAVGGVAASSTEVRSGRYPIARPLTLVSAGAPLGLARQFVEYCLSPQVNDLITEYDFVAYQD